MTLRRITLTHKQVDQLPTKSTVGPSIMAECHFPANTLAPPQLQRDYHPPMPHELFLSQSKSRSVFDAPSDGLNACVPKAHPSFRKLILASMGTGRGCCTVQPVMCPEPTGSKTPHLTSSQVVRNRRRDTDQPSSPRRHKDVHCHPAVMNAAHRRQCR